MGLGTRPSSGVRALGVAPTIPRAPTAPKAVAAVSETGRDVPPATGIEPAVLLVGADDKFKPAFQAALDRHKVYVETADLAGLVDAVVAAAPDLLLLMGEAARDCGSAVLGTLSRLPESAVVPVVILDDDTELDAKLRAFRHGASAIIPRSASIDAIAQRVAELAREIPERGREHFGELGEATLEEFVTALSKQLRTGILSVTSGSGAQEQAVRLVLGRGRPLAEFVDDFVRKLRRHVVRAEPLRYEFDERVGGTVELLGSATDAGTSSHAHFRGERLILADGDSARADIVAQALRARGASVAVTDLEPGDVRVSKLRQIDPSVLIIGDDQVQGAGYALVKRLRQDTRLRWASLLVVSWEQVFSEQMGVADVDRLASTLAGLTEPERALKERAATGKTFDTRLEVTGPARCLRALATSGLPLRVSVHNPRVLTEVDLSDGLIVGATGRLASDPSRELAGTEALAALMVLASGRVRVQAVERPACANLMTTLDVALNMADEEEAPIDPSLPAPPKGAVGRAAEPDPPGAEAPAVPMPAEQKLEPPRPATIRRVDPPPIAPRPMQPIGPPPRRPLASLSALPPVSAPPLPPPRAVSLAIRATLPGVVGLPLAPEPEPPQSQPEPEEEQTRTVPAPAAAEPPPEEVPARPSAFETIPDIEAPPAVGDDTLLDPGGAVSASRWARIREGTRRLSLEVAARARRGQWLPLLGVGLAALVAQGLVLSVLGWGLGALGGSETPGAARPLSVAAKPAAPPKPARATPPEARQDDPAATPAAPLPPAAVPSSATTAEAGSLSPDGSSKSAPTCEALWKDSPPRAGSYPGSAMRESSIGHKAIVAGDLDRAQAAFCRAEHWEEKSVVLKVQLAQVLLLRRDGEQALIWAKRAAALDPESRKAKEVLADALARQGDEARARALWFDIAGSTPDDQREQRALVSREIQAAQRALRQKNLVLAERAYRRAAVIDPSSVGALLGLSDVLVKQGDEGPALLWARRAVASEPRSPYARLALGDALSRSGDSQGAIAQWKEANLLDPKLAEARHRLRRAGESPP